VHTGQEKQEWKKREKGVGRFLGFFSRSLSLSLDQWNLFKSCEKTKLFRKLGTHSNCREAGKEEKKRKIIKKKKKKANCVEKTRSLHTTS
jgi:hypothetical protein